MFSGTRKERLSQLAGQTIIAGFEGPTLPRELEYKIERGALGGIILFSRNVESIKQVAMLTARIRKLARSKNRPLVSVDQEGGRVVRFRAPLTHLPPARAFGMLDDPRITESAGRLVGDELSALGVTLNFAPVLDVDTNPDSPVIGDRSYGNQPECVTRHGLAFARGLVSAGVSPCAKHFPGHGDTELDSHLSLPRTEVELTRLHSIELSPFATWCQNHLGPIMTAHIIVKVLDEQRPATTSRAVITGELREQMRFTGPVISDDLEMGALKSTGGPVQAAVEALRAGVDGLIISRSLPLQNEVTERLALEASRDSAFRERLEEAAKRIGEIAYVQKSRRDINWLGSPEHVARQNELNNNFRGKSS